MNKCYLKDLSELEDEFLEIGEIDFIHKYKNVEIFIGDSDAVKYVENKIKNFIN